MSFQDPFAQDPIEVDAQSVPMLPRKAATPAPVPEGADVFVDVLMSAPRGVEAAAQNAYKLADYLTADALPNWDTRLLGESQTEAGKMTEKVFQFAAGFIPVAGWAGRVGGAFGLAGNAARVAGSAALGAAVDFTVFDGHEERLSNLLKDHPTLKNPVTDFLATDDSDPELVGRFKNALEGLALGTAADGLMGGLRVIKAGRAVKAGKLTAEEASKVVEEASTAAEVGVTFKLKKKELSYDLSPLESAAKEIADFDPNSVEAGAIFQHPKKSIAARFDAPQDAVALQEAVAERLYQDAKASGKLNDVLTNAQVEAGGRKLVAELAQAPEEAVYAFFRAGEQDVAKAIFKQEAAAKIMTGLGNEAAYWANLAANGGAPAGLTREQVVLRSMKAVEALAQMQSIVKGYGTLTGRALQARKLIKTAEIESADMARKLVEQLGGERTVAPYLEKLSTIASKSNPADVAKGVADMTAKSMTFGGKLLRVHNEYWINAVLSGTKTSVVNTLGNSMTTLYQPLEQLIGSAFRADGTAVRASLKNYQYLVRNIAASWDGFKAAWKSGESVLMADSAPLEPARRAIDASFMGIGPESKGLVSEAKAVATGEANLLAHWVNFAGEVTRMPSRFLTSTDEFFKQLNYRSAAQTEFYYRGAKKGLQGEALDRFVAESTDKVVLQSGEMYSEAAIIRQGERVGREQGKTGQDLLNFIEEYKTQHWDPNASALKDVADVAGFAKGVAEEATFTTELGALGKPVQRLVSAHPAFQLVLPFVRTPTNIVKYFGQRGLSAATFLPGVQRLQARNMAELVHENPLVRSRAAGRIAAGNMMVTMAGFAALQGRITGKGPQNEAERKAWMATGAQPYSIVIDSAEGPVYVSYQRLDPMATFLGLVADWTAMAKRQDPWNSDASDVTMTAIATAVSNNITNKTYLASLAQFIDMVVSPDRKFSTWSRARVGSYVPAVMAQFTPAASDDDAMKEVRSFMDGLINRVPGWQNTLEAKRNVLGEPIDSPLAQTPGATINPVVISHYKGDKVFDELARFDHGLQPPSPVVRERINLLHFQTKDGRTAYDRYAELAGEVTLGGKTLRQQLEKLIQSPSYQRLPMTEPADGMTSPRLAEVRKVIQNYRNKALVELQREVPEVREALRGYAQAQAALRRGNASRAAELVQNVIAATN